MHISPTDEQRIKTFYQASLDTYGTDDARSVHWADAHNQRVRFYILSQIANLSQQKILDVGAGLGDLYGFLQSQNISCNYTGIDIIPEFVQQAQARYPDVIFAEQDIFDVRTRYDYVLASGALSFKVADNDMYYKHMIQKMYGIAEKGLAFNMLRKGEHISDETYATYDPQDIYTFCKTLSNQVEIMVDYLPQDFTVYMYKN